MANFELLQEEHEAAASDILRNRWALGGISWVLVELENWRLASRKLAGLPTEEAQ